VRRLRILAVLLDLLICAVVADGVGLVASGIAWFWIPAFRAALGWLWGGAAAGALVAFLLRDARGGRARRWFGLEAVRPDGAPPGGLGSIRRNLPLLIPIWNVYEVWPVLHEGTAARRSDLKTGVRIVSTD